jgi:hypothetical protein
MSKLVAAARVVGKSGRTFRYILPFISSNGPTGEISARAALLAAKSDLAPYRVEMSDPPGSDTSFLVFKQTQKALAELSGTPTLVVPHLRLNNKNFLEVFYKIVESGVRKILVCTGYQAPLCKNSIPENEVEHDEFVEAKMRELALFAKEQDLEMELTITSHAPNGHAAFRKERGNTKYHHEVDSSIRDSMESIARRTEILQETSEGNLVVTEVVFHHCNNVENMLQASRAFKEFLAGSRIDLIQAFLPFYVNDEVWKAFNKSGSAPLGEEERQVVAELAKATNIDERRAIIYGAGNELVVRRMSLILQENPDVIPLIYPGDDVANALKIVTQCHERGLIHETISSEYFEVAPEQEDPTGSVLVTSDVRKIGSRELPDQTITT